jgi:5-methylcytosine-specific restriction protein A
VSVVAFEDIVTSVDLMMGVKAVFGPLKGRAVCFASRGDAALKDRGHFRSARIASEYAEERPYLITIGGGGQVRDNLGGCVLNVSRVSKAYGQTEAFYLDPEERRRLAQWPVATGLLDIYEVEGFPHLVSDLGLPDRTILANAFDIIVRPQGKTEALWEALQGAKLRLVDLPPLPNFREPASVRQVGTMLPKSYTKEEGTRISREVQLFERDSQLAKDARQANREKHGGDLACEACAFTDPLDGMFDVHHLVPLMHGARQTTLADLVVLCPLCHRWSHRKGKGQLDPLPLDDLKVARGGGAQIATNL